jgi:hypothetical protein
MKHNRDNHSDNHKTYRILGGILALVMIGAAVGLAACGAGNTDATEATTVQSETASAVSATTAQTAATASSSDTQNLPDVGEIITTANVTSDGAINASDLFSDRDLRQNADTSGATYYTLESGRDITITAAGVYVITGSAENTSIIVDAGDEDKVQLVLNGVSITNSSAPAIYVKNADKTFVTTVSGTDNSLSVTGTFTADGDTNTDAVIFSKDDLVLNGLGTLRISSTDNGIACKDDLKITGGTITITCSADAIEANESIAIADGSITISSGKDGLHAENDEDSSTGWIYICGGTLSIDAYSDGIQGTSVVQIDGGTIDIDAAEGIEATYVQLGGGSITIYATDDGVNGSNKSSAYNVCVEINGGELSIDMGQGDTDAIDSNGNLYVNGGTLNINANSPFDYDGVGQYNGGTIYVNGELTTELTNQFMGGGMGGMGGMTPGGNMNGGMGGMGGRM